MGRSTQSLLVLKVAVVAQVKNEDGVDLVGLTREVEHALGAFIDGEQRFAVTAMYEE